MEVGDLGRGTPNCTTQIGVLSSQEKNTGSVYVMRAWEELGNTEFWVFWDKKKDMHSRQLDIGTWSARIWVDWRVVTETHTVNGITRKSAQTSWSSEIPLFPSSPSNIRTVSLPVSLTYLPFTLEIQAFSQGPIYSCLGLLYSFFLSKMTPPPQPITTIYWSWCCLNLYFISWLISWVSYWHSWL